MVPIHPVPGESKETARPDYWMGKIREPGQRVEAPNMVIEVSRKIDIAIAIVYIINIYCNNDQ